MNALLRHSIVTAPLTFSLHLARRNPWKAAAAVALILAASLIAGYSLRSSTLALLTLLLLVASISDFLFPIHFQLTDTGVTVRGLLHRRYLEWEKVRRVSRDKLGVKLSPLLYPSRLDAYRGIYVWFENNSEEVMDYIAHHVGPEAARGDDLSAI